MDTSRLKPMGIREVLDNTFSIMRERFWTFQGVIFRSFLPATLILLFGLVIFLIDIYRLQSSIPFSIIDKRFWEEFTTAGLGAKNFMATIVSMILLFIPFLVALVIGGIYMVYGCINVFKCGLHGEPCKGKAVFAGLKGKKGRLFGAQFLIGLMTIPIGFVSVLILTALPWLKDVMPLVNNIAHYAIMFLFSLTPVVVALENKDVTDSLSRAFHLMDNHRWRILGTLAVVYILGYALIIVMIGLFTFPIFIAARFRHIVTIVLAGLSGLAGLFILGTIAIFYYGPFTMIYHDLLIRKEGYDLKLQMAAENSQVATIIERGFTG